MKNILLKFICVFSLALGINTSTRAQLVYIPDPNFRAYLNQNFASCMVGDSIDSSCPAVLNTLDLNIPWLGINDITGIIAFSNLLQLHCAGNNLTFLPPLPYSLGILACNNNQITNLPPANQLWNLIILWCYSNNLTSLSPPPNLTILDCSDNQISSIGTLPSTLTRFDCYSNQLTSLPNLPNSISSITNCSNNLLTSLPNIPTSAQGINCGFNKLTSLPIIPNTLSYLYCNHNLLTSLPSLSTKLKTLNCYNNQLTNLPAIPNSLWQLSCGDNQLTVLPPLHDSLGALYCYNNMISTLPSLPNYLEILQVQTNQLSSIPTLPLRLRELNCSKNQITSLPNLSDSLLTLNCSKNPINCLPALKRVKNLNIDSTNINCLPQYGVVTTCIPPISNFSLCDVFNVNSCDIFWNIEGKSYIDSDTNCIKSQFELQVANQKIELLKNGILEQQTFTNKNGNYDFNTHFIDSYTIKLDTTELPFDVICPGTFEYTDSITAIDSLKYDRDFGLNCKGIDLAVTNIFSGNIRPASIREIKIQAGDFSNYFNLNCASGISGLISIAINGDCVYHSPSIGALTPNSVIGNVLTYNVTDFGLISYDSSFNFNILVDTTAVLGGQICIQVSIATATTELNYNNNLLAQCFTIVGGFDPNDKTVSPSSSLDISGDRWLTYLIRFQNTGTADAEHIYITDTMSTLLDWSTFNLLSYSHQPLTQVYNDGLVKFSFPNIHLPDSNTNEPASHGYVQYKIRAKDSLAIGSTIENTANIFFDFNAPVITNTTSNIVINCSIPPTYVSTTICQGEVFILNSAVYLSPGTFYQTLKTPQGCDSTIILNITMLPRSEYHISDSICDGTSINFNGQTLSTAGIFKDTLINSIGCDSIIYFNLSILAKSTNQLTEQICAGDTFNLNGQLLSLAGQYSDTLLNSIGCDSIVNLELSIIPTFTFQTAAICNRSSYAFGGQILTSSGIYADSLLNILGCDSIINLTLQVNPSYFTQQSITTCDFEPYLFDGNLLTQSGTYYDSLLTINGCDSIIELQLNVTGLTNVITQTSSTLQTQATGSAYVWINCATNQFIFGASGPSFQPIQSGDYAVAVTYGNCIDTSSCFAFSMVGLPSSIAGDVIFQTRYNSNADQIQLHAEKLKGNKGFLRLMDLSGRIIFQKQIENIAAGNLDLEIPTKGMNAGIYLVNLITELDNISGKVVKY